MDNKHSDTSSMCKKCIEICLISARGLPRSTLLKHQWYAVGWIDPTNKYCTKIDASGSPNPVWKTKFTTVIDTVLDSNSRDVMLNVEVYSREPLFLREKLQGTASINLKEFLCKYSRNIEGCKEGNEDDVDSFQLRKKNNKPLGFIDVSVKVSEEKEGACSYSFLGHEEGFNLQDNSSITLATGQMHQPAAHPYAHPVPYPRNHLHPTNTQPAYPPITVPMYPPTRMPPPPQPPSNVGNIPTILPQANTQSTSYLNMPSSSGGTGRGVGPGFGVGMGVGALAAGGVIFGSDLMSGFELPTVMSNPSLTMSINPPF